MAKRMVMMLAALLLSAATVASAADVWVSVATVMSDNARISISPASIESVGQASVRCAVHMTRKDPEVKKWAYTEVIDYNEIVLDIDCARPRHKFLKEIRYGFTGEVYSLPVSEAYQLTPENSVYSSVREYACRAEGKMK
jgi:hypothetical protein